MNFFARPFIYQPYYHTILNCLQNGSTHPFPTMTIEQLKELKDKLAVLRRYL